MKRKLRQSFTRLNPSTSLNNSNPNELLSNEDLCLTSSENNGNAIKRPQQEYLRPNSKTPLLQRIVLPKRSKGQYYRSPGKANHGTENNGPCLEQRLTKLVIRDHTLLDTPIAYYNVCPGQHKSDFNLTNKISYSHKSTSDIVNSGPNLTIKGLLKSLCSPLRFAYSAPSIGYKKRDLESESSSTVEIPIIHSASNMEQEIREQRREQQQQLGRQSKTSSPLSDSHMSPQREQIFQVSLTEQKFLKSMRTYALGISAFALCCTASLVFLDRINNSPSIISNGFGGGEFARGTRGLDSGNSRVGANIARHVDGQNHRRFDNEGFVAKLREEFHEWINHHGRDYGSDEEKEKRFHIWKENHMRTIEKNKKHGPCKLTGEQVFGSNHFKDLSAEEFKAKYLTGYNGPKMDELNEKHRRKLRSTSNILDTEQRFMEEETSYKLSSNGLHDPSMLSHKISRHESVQERYLKHIEQTPKLSKTYYNKEEKAVEKACKCGSSYNGRSRRLSGLFQRDKPLFGKTYYSKSEKQKICGTSYGKTYYKAEKNNKNNYYNSYNGYNNYNSYENYNNNYNNYNNNDYNKYSYSKNNNNYNNNYYNYNYNKKNSLDCKKYRLQADVDYDELSNKRKSSISCNWYDATCWMQRLFTPLYASSESAYSKNYNYPSSIDWREIGATTSVHNQGSCGACWAITATETIEAANFISTGVLLDLSETEIIVCEDSCQMCDGGWPQNAYEYVKENNGLPSESSSSYDGSFLMTMTLVTSGESDEMSENEVENIKQSTCPAEGGSGDNNNAESSSATRYGAINDWAYATDRCICYTDGSGCACDEQNEALAVMNVASYGPATVCLEASMWQDYTGGVITAENSGCTSAFLDMNHCVQVVGYSYMNVEEGEDEGAENDHERDDNNGQLEGYWIVRNQWSSYWGMNGYAYVAMGNNTCGILNDMTQVFMD